MAKRLRVSIAKIHHGSNDADPIGQVPVYRDREGVDGVPAPATALSPGTVRRHEQFICLLMDCISLPLDIDYQLALVVLNQILAVRYGRRTVR